MLSLDDAAAALAPSGGKGASLARMAAVSNVAADDPSTCEAAARRITYQADTR